MCIVFLLTVGPLLRLHKWSVSKIIEAMLVLVSRVYNIIGICAATGRAPSGYQRPNLSGSVHAAEDSKRRVKRISTGSEYRTHTVILGQYGIQEL